MWSGHGPRQRSIEALVRSELKPGFPDGPPRRPRTWLGAAGLAALILAGLLLLVSDALDRPDASPVPETPPPITD